MNPQTLTNQQIEEFLANGYIVLRDCFPKQAAADWTAYAFERLGYKAEDPSTWEKARIHLHPTRWVDVETFAPKAYAGISDLIGPGRAVEPLLWADTFVVNLREGADRPYELPSASAKGWHKDGYFFRHFLDSPEQGLLVIVAWTDVLSRGGGTFLAADSVGVISRYLADHPEGVSPDVFGSLVNQCKDFREITANAGDVVLLHPYMLHAISQNVLRVPRIISNPLVFNKEPMKFNRPNPADFSPVEQAVLRGLGVDRLDYRPTAARQGEIPEWVVKAQQELTQAKLESIPL